VRFAQLLFAGREREPLGDDTYTPSASSPACRDLSRLFKVPGAKELGRLLEPALNFAVASDAIH